MPGQRAPQPAAVRAGARAGGGWSPGYRGNFVKRRYFSRATRRFANFELTEFSIEAEGAGLTRSGLPGQRVCRPRSIFAQAPDSGGGSPSPAIEGPVGNYASFGYLEVT